VSTFWPAVAVLWLMLFGIAFLALSHYVERRHS